MITRKIGKIILGNVTPFQIAVACVLGAIIGFLPGIAQAPGLFITLLILLMTLNANLVVASCIGFLAKLLSLCLIPASFAVGRILLDGPTQGLFKWMINEPVLALFGLEYYATIGGALLGFVFGLIMGLLFVKVIIAVRRKMASLEEGSVSFQQWASKRWVKFLMFSLVGGGPRKHSWSELLNKKFGNPIRPIGAIFAGLVVVMLVLILIFTSGPIVTSALRSGLERVNGATVDIDRADVSLSEGRMTVEGFAMADPNALDTDLLRAVTIEINISGTDLLRKRLKLDSVVMTDASYGAKRIIPGRIIGSKPPDTGETREGEKSLDDYVKNAKAWKERLAKIRQWLEALSGPSDKTVSAKKTEAESLSDWLEREIQIKGYANVSASHLIEGTPKLVVSELIAEKVSVQGFGSETIDILGKDLSTHPYLLVDHIPSITIMSSNNTLNVDLKLAGVTPAKGENTIEFAYRGLDTDSIAEHLAFASNKSIAGGTIDVEMEGAFQTTAGTYLDLPMQVTLHNTTVTLPGSGSVKVEKLQFPLEIRGPLDNPRITVDNSKLADALVQAGTDVLTGKLKGEANKLLEKENEQIFDKAKGFFEGIFGGKKKEKQSQ
ncbi:MAG: hypothetical protein ACE5KZ_13060 [Candidatus Scalinduaceae bacterium]